jgi:hypothetical protein
VTPKRRMTYRFYGLSKNLQRVIAHRLGLYTDADASLPEGQLFENYYRRASEDHTLARFWEEIEKEHGNTDFSNNPFA